jgi:5-methylcytosine-specific restriction enzyme A
MVYQENSMSFEDTKIFLFSKLVDYSILHQGVTIPVRVHQILIDSIGKPLEHGKQQIVKIRIEGKTYEAKLDNIGFDQNQYNRTDLLRFRWSGNILKDLRRIFNASYLEFASYKSNKNISGISKPISNESIAFSYNFIDHVIDTECISSDDLLMTKEIVSSLPEEIFEFQQNYFQADLNSSLVYKEADIKVRRIDRSIINYLKNLYDYHCQICGTYFDKYNVRFIEAHHIVPFVQTMNNDTDNIMIVCPNHHRIIHSAKPEFFPREEYLIYPNGFREQLTLNNHLGKDR